MATQGTRNSYPFTAAIRVTGMKQTGSAETIAQGLSRLDGLMDVSVKKGRVVVTYDLRCLRRQAIEAALGDLGYPLDTGWLARTLRDVSLYFEKNGADAMAIVHQCCNASSRDSHTPTP